VRAELRPTDIATIPRHRWYVVSRDTPGAPVSATMDSEETPDIVCVVYRAYGVTGVRDGTIRRVYYPAAPTSVIERVQLIDLSSQYMADTDAANYAANVMLRAAADVMAATVTAKGGLRTVDGHFRPAPLILAGDWIDVVDLPGHVPTYITGTTFSKSDGVVTITTGGREQSELIVPGISALPSALTRYGEAETYDTYSDDSEDDDTYDDGYIPDDGTHVFVPGEIPTPDPGGFTLLGVIGSGGFIRPTG